MSLEYIILATIFSIPVMLVLFIIVAKIHFAMHTKVLHFVLGTVFSVLNFLANAWTISIIGLELPREFTTTARLKRWKKLNPTSRIRKWRVAFATKICQILNNYDPGHC